MRVLGKVVAMETSRHKLIAKNVSIFSTATKTCQNMDMYDKVIHDGVTCLEVFWDNLIIPYVRTFLRGVGQDVEGVGRGMPFTRIIPHNLVHSLSRVILLLTRV